MDIRTVMLTHSALALFICFLNNDSNLVDETPSNKTERQRVFTMSRSADSLDRSQRKLHVQIADSTTTPEHSFVEKIHTPKRGPSGSGQTTEEWLEAKHAHIDDDALSPSGLVDRAQTPICTPNDRGFQSTVEEVNNELREEERKQALEARRRNVQSAITFVIGVAVGGAAVHFLVRRSK